MSATTMTRAEIAADLLGIKKDKGVNLAAEVQKSVRAMTKTERARLTARIDGVIAWVAEYEHEETLCAA